MRGPTVAGIALLLITVPAILESCCGGISGSDPYYDIDDMTIEILAPGSPQVVPPSKLSDITFMIILEPKRTAHEDRGGSALYACSPAPTISNQQVSAILITSSDELSTDVGGIIAGESLNFVFKAHSVSQNNAPVSDVIGNPILDERIMFRSDVVLSKRQSHSFTFKITLSDGRTFTLVSEMLDLIEG
jgi:hypothetical protein